MPSETPKSRSSFLRAFLVSVLGTGLSRIFGAARDIIVATVFGAGAGSDAFWIAFTVPNVFRRFVADEGLTGAVIPAIAKAESEEGDARPLANTLFSGLLLANFILCLFGYLYAEWLVKAFAYSFTEDTHKFALTVTMTRWMFPFVAMVSAVSYFEGLLNHRGHFFVPKIAPALVSLGIAGSAMGLTGLFAEPPLALAVGVLLGGVAHLIIHIPVLKKHWGPLRPGFEFGNPRVKQVGKELGKVIIIGIFAQLNILVLRQLAATLGDGAITRYWYANRLVDLSQGVIAVAIGSALLPTISQAIAERDIERFQGDLHRAFRLAAVILIPVAACLIPYAVPLTSMLFRHGAYSWEDVLWTSWTLQALTPFLLAVAGINIIKKAYFAIDDRNTLLLVGLFGVGLTAFIGWLLVESQDVRGLAFALSISTVLQFLIYLYLLPRRLSADLAYGSLKHPLIQVLKASLVPFVLLTVFSGFGQWENGPAELRNWVVFFAGAALAVLAYALAAKWLKIQELNLVIQKLRRRRTG